MLYGNDADLLTSRQIATSAGVANYENLKFSEMDSKLSFWNLMVSLRPRWAPLRLHAD